MLGKQWVFDFDDAIWTTDRVKEPYLLRLLKTRSKIQYQLRHATLVLAGNTYLKSFAASFNAQVEVFPTVVDTNRFDMPEKDKVSNELVVGWTGTHSTLPYLMQWLPLLRSVYQSCPFVLHLICNVTPPIEFPSVRITLWHADSESKDLEAFDIGIMPLPDDPWTKGKCGFKAIQYMAKGIPTIASPVGVNTELIEHGISGLLADTREEWSEALLLLLHDEQSRRAMGLAARRTIEERYSKRAVETLFVQRIKACLAK
jgi:glycosyltransferase involved in cell wall biosynthesis